jgi:hypothetical protein
MNKDRMIHPSGGMNKDSVMVSMSMTNKTEGNNIFVKFGIPSTSALRKREP